MPATILGIADAFLNLVPVTIAQSLLYGFVALGVMVPFRLLSFPDLTCEAAFPAGGCLCAALLIAGAPPGLAMLGALAAGCAVGCATTLIHYRFRINTLLAGILVVTMTWSVNLRGMGRSNVALFTAPSVFDVLDPAFSQAVGLQIGLWLLLAAVACGGLYAFLRTDLGLALRATGANGAMARAQGIDTRAVTLAGVAAANGITALAGASVAQVQGFADVTMGFGVLINALAALIIGEAVIGRTSLPRQVAAPFVGSILYYQVVSLGLVAGIHPSDLKLFTGLFVLAMLALSSRRGGAPMPEVQVNA